MTKLDNTHEKGNEKGIIISWKISACYRQIQEKALKNIFLNGLRFFEVLFQRFVWNIKKRQPSIN
jgi:hypothetical protein